MTERFPCKTPGCEGRIVADTVAKTGGYCMPCVQNEARRKREEEIARNRVDVDRFEGVTDPVQVVELMHVSLKHDPLKNYLPYPRSKADVVMDLSEADLSRLIDRTEGRLTHRGADDEAELDEVTSIATTLACLTSIDLGPIQRALLKARSPYPGVVYRGAEPAVVELLTKSLEGGASELLLNHVLVALAWAGGPRVEALFASWANSPPDWAEHLHVPAHNYALEAGWFVNDAGAATPLWKHDCRSLDVGISEEESVAFSDGEKPCPQCSRPLLLLLDLDLRKAELSFLTANRERLQIPACIVCSCYGLMMFQVKPDGSWAVHPASPKPEYLPGPDEEFDLPAPALSLGKPRPALATADWCLEAVPGSQIGGAPSWVQDAEYPRCPDCRQPMPFIGQVAMQDIEEYGEGLYYGFFCNSCGVAASSYQQS